MQFQWLLTLVSVCLGAEIHVITRAYYCYVPYYLNIKPTTTTDFFFKVKGPRAAYIGLTSAKHERFVDQPLYEVVIAGWAGARTIGMDQNTTFIRNETGPFNKSSNESTFLPEFDFRTFWLSWRDSRLQLGFGSMVGEETIFNADVSQVGYDIKYIGLTSSITPDTYWIYYDAEPVTSVPHASPLPGFLRQFVPKASDRDYINDNNTDTCMEVSPDGAGSFLMLGIAEVPPVEILLKLKSIPSCETSNILIFTDQLIECPITGSFTNNGTSECIYRCMDDCSSRVTITFQKAKFGPQSWSICEVMEKRNWHMKIFNMSEGVQSHCAH